MRCVSRGSVPTDRSDTLRHDGPVVTADWMLSPVMEDYLKTIYHLQRRDGERVSTSAIAEELDVTAPSVTSMVGKLEERGLVEREKYAGVRLTPDGERVALEVIRHHRLLEVYLAEHLDYDWSEVHEEADRLEHHISEAFEERMAAALAEPTVDPHGAPIPGADLEPPVSRVEGDLTDVVEGDRVIVEEVRDEEPAVLEYLADHGVRPQVELEIIEVAPFGMVTVQPADRSETVSIPERIAPHVKIAPVKTDE